MFVLGAMAIFIEYPWGALPVAVALAALHRVRPRRPNLVAAAIVASLRVRRVAP